MPDLRVVVRELVGFYLRKSFKTGPLRFNLSKSGIGASVGVKGLRVGTTARGKSYIHAGRGGLYFRQSLGTTSSRQSSRLGSTDPTVLYENTGAAFGSPVTMVERNPLTIRPAEPSLKGPSWTLGLAAFAMLISLPDPIWTSVWVIAALASSALLVNRSRIRRALLPIRDEIDSILEQSSASRRLEFHHLQQLLAVRVLSDALREAEAKRAWLKFFNRVLEDGRIEDSEIAALETLAHEIDVPAEFIREQKIDAYREILLEAVADHDLTDDEDEKLQHILAKLELTCAELSEELKLVERLREVRSIRNGDLPEVEPTVAIQKSEICHYEAPGRFLKEKQLRTFQQDGQRYKIRGLSVDKEGTLLLTNKRILLVHSGTSSFKYDKVLDVQVDVDENVIRISVDGRGAPVIISTPDSLRAGALIAQISNC